jgi:hypothetical protein
MTIKAGEVAFLKTTGESVFVLQYPNETSEATVRRPIAGRDGIDHIKESFRHDELETLEEQKHRFMSEREELLAKYITNPNQTPSPTDLGFSNN